MKKYFKINIIEFIIIAALIYCWATGVIHVIGLAVLYILATTREKWVMNNKLEKLTKKEPQLFTANGQPYQEPKTPISFYFQDKLIGRGYVPKNSCHIDRVMEAKRLECIGFDKFMLELNEDRGAQLKPQGYFLAFPDVYHYEYNNEYWEIL